MGSCITKSKPKNSPSPSPIPPSKDPPEAGFVQDKLVVMISSHPSPSSSSPLSLFPYTNSTTSSSSSSISSCSSSSSSSVSNSNDKPSYSSLSSSSSYSYDYLWSRIKENPHLTNQATQYKGHGIPQTLVGFQKPELSLTKSTLSSEKKKKQSVIHPAPQKRACSTTSPISPNTVSRQKSYRRDRLQQLPNVQRRRHQLITTTTCSSVPATKSKRNNNLHITRYSSSPIRRSKGGNKEISKINSTGRKKSWNHEELHIYNINMKETSTRPAVPSSSPQAYNYKRNKDGLDSTKNRVIGSTTTTTHHIYDHEMDGVGEEEEKEISSSCITDKYQDKEYYLNSAVVSSSTDDIDNPLISLDCFIFL